MATYNCIYVAGRASILTERQIRLLQKHRGRTGDPEQHVEAPYPGYLLCQTRTSSASELRLLVRFLHSILTLLSAHALGFELYRPHQEAGSRAKSIAQELYRVAG